MNVRRSETAALPARRRGVELFAAGAVCAVAFALRLWIFAGAPDYPRFELIRNRLDDQVTFVEWAQAMARGERYVVDGGRHEYAWWAAARPGVLPQAALYPFVLSIVLRADLSLDTVRLAQLVLGALSSGLLVLVAVRFASLAAAVSTGLLMALHAPLIFYEMTFLRAAALTPLIVGVLFALLAESPPRGRCLVGGLALGLAVTLRSSVLPAALLIVSHQLWRERAAWRAVGSRGERLRRTVSRPSAALALGLLLPLVVPLSLNLARAGALTLSSNGPFNLYLANVHDADGLVASPTPTYDALKASGPPESISLVWETVRDIVTHPGAWLQIELGKARALLSAREVPNNLSFAMGRRAAPRLRWAFVHWGVLLPLGVLGVLLTLTCRRAVSARDLSTLHLLTLGSVVVLLLFTVMARQRLVLVPLLSLYAAMGLDHVALWWRRGSRQLGLVAGVGLVAAGLWGQSTFLQQRPRPVDFQMAAAAAERQGELAEEQGRVRAARRSYGRAVSFHPSGSGAQRLAQLGVAPRRPSEEVMAACEAARQRADTGDRRGAVRELRRLSGRYSDAATPARYLSNFAMLDGDRRTAERWAEEVLRRDPLDEVTRRNLAELRRLLSGG